MIIRLYEHHDTFLVKERSQLAGKGGGAFGRINLLMFSSAELRETFGLYVSESDFSTAFELNRGLAQCGDRPTDAAIRNKDVARLVTSRPELLSCFIAYQESPDGKLLPLMTDGPESRWSLFFDREGGMILAEHERGEWKITPQADLLPEQESGRKSFLLNGLKSARKIIARNETTD